MSPYSIAFILFATSATCLPLDPVMEGPYGGGPGPVVEPQFSEPYHRSGGPVTPTMPVPIGSSVTVTLPESAPTTTDSASLRRPFGWPGIGPVHIPESSVSNQPAPNQSEQRTTPSVDTCDCNKRRDIANIIRPFGIGPLDPYIGSALASGTVGAITSDLTPIPVPPATSIIGPSSSAVTTISAPSTRPKIPCEIVCAERPNEPVTSIDVAALSSIIADSNSIVAGATSMDDCISSVKEAEMSSIAGAASLVVQSVTSIDGAELRSTVADVSSVVAAVTPTSLPGSVPKTVNRVPDGMPRTATPPTRAAPHYGLPTVS